MSGRLYQHTTDFQARWSHVHRSSHPPNRRATYGSTNALHACPPPLFRSLQSPVARAARRPYRRYVLSSLPTTSFVIGFSLGPMSASPSDINGPQSHGCGVITADGQLPVPSPPLVTAATANSSIIQSNSPSSPLVGHTMSNTGTNTIDDVCDPNPNGVTEYVIRSLSRSALRMLWHQRLGHLNFRRLSTMHRFVKGMPEFTLPNELESCPVCLAAKLRKQPAGSATTMRSTICNQGISIDFGFMVQRSKNTKRQHNLVGLNGETCYAMITDHYSGRIYGRAFASKAPPVEWLNNWQRSNMKKCHT